MNKKLIILAACFGLTSAAVAATVNFDQGIDIKSVVKAAADSEVQVPEARFPTIENITRDCKKIVFGANDPLTSPVVLLKSEEYGRDCENMGPPVYQICRPYSREYSAESKVVITAPRTLQPGQKEVFEVCLWGSYLSLKQVSPAYKYSVRQVLDVFELTPPPAALPKSPPQDPSNKVK